MGDRVYSYFIPRRVGQDKREYKPDGTSKRYTLDCLGCDFFRKIKGVDLCGGSKAFRYLVEPVLERKCFLLKKNKNKECSIKYLDSLIENPELLEWNPEKRIQELPFWLQKKFIEQAEILYEELKKFRLQVTLGDALEQKHVSHKIRHVEERPPSWYSALYQELNGHVPKQKNYYLKRGRMLSKLKNFIKGKDRISTIHSQERPRVKRNSLGRRYPAKKNQFGKKGEREKEIKTVQVEKGKYFRLIKQLILERLTTGYFSHESPDFEIPADKLACGFFGVPFPEEHFEEEIPF